MRALGGEGVFTLSVSFADSSPRVGAKGRPELGQALGHHDRPPSCVRPLASPFGRGAPDGAERAFLPSQSLRDSSPKVGAKGRSKFGQAFGHHGRLPILWQSPCLSLWERCPGQGGEGVLPSQSLRDSSPRVGAKGQSELGKCPGLHGRLPILRQSPCLSLWERCPGWGGEGVFTLSVSFADSSPRVGAKGRSEIGQAFGHHGRPSILRQSPCLSLWERCPGWGGEGVFTLSVTS